MNVSHHDTTAHNESEMMMAMYLDFEVQQVAVDLVVNIGVVLLLAQVQPWDVHRGLEAQQRDRITHTQFLLVSMSVSFDVPNKEWIYKHTRLLCFPCMMTEPGFLAF